MLIARENQAGAIPVVLWAGKIVEDAMGWLVDMGLIPGADGVSYNTPYMQVRFNPCFISLEGCVHPSSALMGESRAILKATYQCFAALCVQPHRSAALLYAAVDAYVVNDTLVRVDAYDMVRLPHDNGWLSNNFRHLREANWSDQNVTTSFLRLRDVCGDGNFLRLAEYSIGAHVEEPAFVDNVCTLLSAYNAERVMRMLCTCSVVANLGKPAWMAVLTQLVVTYGEEPALRLAGHDSVASRMLNAAWMAVLAQLVVTYGEEPALRLAGHDSVASRMLNAAWMAVLAQLVVTYGEEPALRLAGHNSVAVKMLNAAWMAVLAQLVVTYSEVRALRLTSCDGVASRMLNAAWMAVLAQLVVT